MSLTARMFVITICINLMLTMVGLSLGGNDVMNKFLMIDTGTNELTPTGEFTGTIPTQAEEGFAPGGQTFSFIDGLRMALNFFFMLIVSLFLPVYWAFHLAMPWYMGVLLFLESAVTMIALVGLIRGVGS